MPMLPFHALTVPARLRALAIGLALASGGLATGAAACDAAPPAMRDIDIPRFYSDAAGTIVDPKLKAAHDAAQNALTAFLRDVTGNSDKAIKRTKPAEQKQAADCALAWIATWAKADAWLGTMAQQQAEYQRKWDLAGTALAYLKVRKFASPEQRAVIEPWLIRFADATVKFFDNPERKRNNHWYWQGVGLAAVGLAADSKPHWERAKGIMADATKDIAADGTLPMELERGARALHYHAFSCMPVVAMAALGRAGGEDWLPLNNNAVDRLVQATAKGLADPTIFDKLAKVPQERPVNPFAGWAQLYTALKPGVVLTVPPDLRDGHRWLGGDVAVLGKVLADWKK
jgi:poly(beta-D-mannuronate) lyase